jgi:hypothetical protein
LPANYMRWGDRIQMPRFDARLAKAAALVDSSDTI